MKLSQIIAEADEHLNYEGISHPDLNTIKNIPKLAYEYTRFVIRGDGSKQNQP